MECCSYLADSSPATVSGAIHCRERAPNVSRLSIFSVVGSGGGRKYRGVLNSKAQSFRSPLLRHRIEAEGSAKRRWFLSGAAAVASTALMCSSQLTAGAVVTEKDSRGVERLQYNENGYQSWEWRGHKINYVVEGPEDAPPLLLVHGFGASVYHWRYNIPVLARNFRVYAIDLLGFGWSAKPVLDYNAKVWREQLADFLTEIVKTPALLAGNSVGGYAVLNTTVYNPNLVSGVILLNVAGKFDDPKKRGVTDASLIDDTSGLVPPPEGGKGEGVVGRLLGPVKKLGQKAMLYLTFLQAKQAGRIRSVLMQVYADPVNVDDALVESIVGPTRDANAAEVYYRLTSQVLLDSSSEPVNRLIERLNRPMLLLWGDLDPWMTPSKADRIMALYPSATRVRLNAGHCPHDEKPEAVNKAILKWGIGLTSKL